MLDIDKITDDELPTVNENAINAVASEKEEKIEQAVKVDGFDPEIHATDESGNPQYTASGNLKKKRGRKKGQTQSTLNLDDKKEQEKVNLGSRETAITISGLLEITQCKLISNEFEYNEIERHMNIEAWTKTLDYYGGVSLTPPQELALSHMQIILTRAMSEKNKETKAKFGLVKAWFNHKFSKMNFKRKKDDKDNGSHDDSGQDRKRENNASQENGEVVAS